MLRRNIFFSSVAVAALGAGAAAILGPDFMPDSADSGLEIRVNLPAYELEVWDGEELLGQYPVTIGAPRYATPTGEYAVDRIIWNPWWNPPESDWAKDAKKTPPGPGNPMGRAKLRFEGLLYIHGSSREDQLGEARSHGCIRLANADVLELARLIGERSGQIEASELDRLEGNHRATREVALERPVRVVISYRLVEERGGEVRSHEDVYQRGMRPHEREMLEARESESAGVAPPTGGG